MRELIVGIDVGTTLIKAIAFDSTGKVSAASSGPNEYTTPQQGWIETSMEGLWERVARVVAALTVQLDDFGSVRAVGISAYMGGAWLLDKGHHPVRAGILWNDGRTVDLLDGWRRNGIMEETFQISCNAPCPGFTVPLIRWIKDNEPEVLDNTRWFLFAKDWIRIRLTGNLATDESDASHAPGDAVTRRFSENVASLFGVPEFMELLPAVVDSGNVSGYVTNEAAHLTGLPVGTPVITGLADVSAALTGAGMTTTGQACSILGTSCLNSVVTDRPHFDPVGIGLSFLLPGCSMTRTMPNQTGTIALEWFKRELGSGLVDADFDAMVREVPRGSRGIVFHPYMNSTGVLAPVYEPRARGRLWGLGVEHTRIDILRSIFEGIACAMADCFDLLPSFVEPVRLIGGGAQSAVWRQIIADVTGHTLVLAETGEPGALGVAMLAGTAVGIWKDLNEAMQACCRNGEIIEPDPDGHAEYQRLLEIFRFLRRNLIEEQEVRNSISES